MNASKITVVINRFGMGDAPEELSLTLVKNYLSLMAQEEMLPSYICLYANGVKLVLEGSPVIEELKALEEKGTKILICKTCLNYFNAVDKTLLGTVATMVDIIGAQTNCDKVINI